MEACGEQEALILVRLLQGSPPWSFLLKTPDGALKQMTGISDRTYLYQTHEVLSLSLLFVIGLLASVLARVIVRAQFLLGARTYLDTLKRLYVRARARRACHGHVHVRGGA